MNVVPCPHCGNKRIVTARVPRDVVVILACPSCHELVVMFRGKVAALNREIIENGSQDEKRTHIADIILEFVEPGMFPSGLSLGQPDSDANPFADDAETVGGEDDQPAPEEKPISQSEVDRFVRVELKRIDDPAYFRRYLG